MTDTMIKIAMFLGDNGQAALSRAMFAEIERDLAEARVEVLAACSERIDLFMENIGNYSDEFGKKRPFKTWDRDDWEAAALRLLSDVQDALDNLQPAASDLAEHDKRVRYQEYEEDERTMRDTFERFSTRMELRLNPLLSLMDFLYAVYEKGRRDAENIAYAQREALLRKERAGEMKRLLINAERGSSFEMFKSQLRLDIAELEKARAVEGKR